MAYIVGVKYGGSATDSWDAESNSLDGTVTGTYIVKLSPGETDCDVNASTILSTPGIPRLGSPLSWAPSIMYLASRTTTEISDQIWEVECEYQIFPPDKKPEPDQPWNVAPEWSWSSTTFNDVLHYSYDDDEDFSVDGPIVNTLGDKLPAPARPENSPVLTLKIPRIDFDYKKEMEYVNTVNSAPFWGWDKYQALMQDISAQRAETNGFQYWNVTYKIAFKSLKVELTPGEEKKEVGWRLVLLNEGPEYLGLAYLGLGRRTKFKTPEGDAYIGQLKNDSTAAGEGEYYWRAFCQYDLKNFNSLGNMGPY